MDYESILSREPYSLSQSEKEKIYIPYMRKLTAYHESHCEKYKTLLRALGCRVDLIKSIADIPMIPVNLFKQEHLSSVVQSDSFKIMTSSGTTGKASSKIYLDARTAEYQQRTLIKIVSDYIGTKRLPMLIIDSPEVLRNRSEFSGRGAGVLGFSIFSSRRQYALDGDMNLDVKGITSFLNRFQGSPILVFGFTYIIWKHFCQAMKIANIHFDLSQAILIHGGGWKKMINQAVTKDEFKLGLQECCGIKTIHNYYGMVEQTGCIYMECEYGHLHASTYSEILFRNMKDFSVCDVGEIGTIQVLSPMTESYPGHSILTDDEGILLGIDNCPCGRTGKYFAILGRLQHAELKGCSDTYEG